MNKYDITILSTEGLSGKTIADESVNFMKWMNQNYSNISIFIPHDAKQESLNSMCFYMPLVKLALDMELLEYLQYVIEYIKFMSRGNLKSQDVAISLHTKYYENGQLETMDFNGNLTAFKELLDHMKDK